MRYKFVTLTAIIATLFTSLICISSLFTIDFSTSKNNAGIIFKTESTIVKYNSIKNSMPPKFSNTTERIENININGYKTASLKSIYRSKTELKGNNKTANIRLLGHSSSFNMRSGNGNFTAMNSISSPIISHLPDILNDDFFNSPFASTRACGFPTPEDTDQPGMQETNVGGVGSIIIFLILYFSVKFYYTRKY